MTMKKNIALALSSAALILSVGCSDSSSSNEETTTGTAIDGYLSGADACIDVNNNGIADVNAGDSPCTKTDDNGDYKLPASLVAANPVAITGGTDVLTGEAYVGSMSAPAGATVVTPLTTLVNAVVKAKAKEGVAITAEDVVAAQKSVSVALGLHEDTDLVNLDPIEEMSKATTAGTGTETIQKVLAAQTKIQVIQQSIATAVASASTETTEEGKAAAITTASASIAKQLAIVIANDDTSEAITLDATAVKSLATASAKEVYADNTAAQTSVNSVVEATAEATVVVAEAAKSAIEDAAGQEEALTETGSAIAVTNKTVTTKVNAAAEEVKTSGTATQVTIVYTDAKTSDAKEVAAKVTETITKIEEKIKNEQVTPSGAQ